MKKILLILLIIFTLTACKENREQIKENNNKIFTLSLIKTENCNHVLTEYYTYENRTVYLVCLDEIYLNREYSKDITLKYHFQNVNQSFEQSIEQLVNDMLISEILKDGGTTIYKKNEYTIILCNTINNNKDIYIGDETLKYQQGFCR